MVPVTAIVRDGATAHVYVQRTPERFEFREVQTRRTIGNNVEVTSGLGRSLSWPAPTGRPSRARASDTPGCAVLRVVVTARGGPDDPTAGRATRGRGSRRA